MTKPRIQLVGGCASSFFVDSALSGMMTEPCNDAKESVAGKGGEAGVLLEQLLVTIIEAQDASAGMVRVLSPNGDELRTVGSSGSGGVCHVESVVDTQCGTCGKSVSAHSIELSSAEGCKNKNGGVVFGDACRQVLAVPFGNGETGAGPEGVLTLFFTSEQNMTEAGKRILLAYAKMIQAALASIWRHEDRHQCDLLDERQSIANEIHDSLAQTLYFAKMRASLLLDALKTDNDLLSFKCAQDIEEALESSQKTVRELVTHFRCQMDPKGLRFALQKLVNDFVARTNISFEYVNEIETLVLPAEYELQIFLIVREALVNVATHSGATAAGLQISLKEGQYQFKVEDNGAGVGSGEPIEGHYGLEIMRERALRIGGEVKVTSLQGLGTSVQLIFGAPEA